MVCDHNLEHTHINFKNSEKKAY